jgi:pyruvate dehydrogenase E2 component (dihydrolipoamide acetyltransferase)
MESGSIASWNLKEGDTFSAGDVMCSVETDKATVDFEAQDDGVLAKILVDAGPDEIKCGQPILVTVEEGVDVSAFVNFKLDENSSSPPAPPPKSTPIEAPTPAVSESVQSASPPSFSVKAQTDRVVASPLAFKLAKEMGYSLQSIPGTGPGGRIIAADVKEYVPGVAETTTTAAAAEAKGAPTETTSQTMIAGPPVAGDGYTDFPISEAAKEIAARLSQSKRNVPHYYLTVDITMDNLLKTRSSLNDALGGEISLGAYELLLKAAAISMKAVPSANASWMDSVVRVYDSVDINVVVGSGDTLATPLIRDCGRKGVKSISEELSSATAHLEEGDNPASSPPASALGTFTVTNIGMYGVKSCAPIIREPQACALALGALENRIVPSDDENSEEIYKESVVMTATLSCDHRVVDGAVGAQWLGAFKSHVENPSTLLL